MPVQNTSLRSSSPSRAPSSRGESLKIDDLDAALALFDRARAETQDERESTNIFAYGFPGDGKTSLIATGRAPIVLYQFDPKGHISIQPEIDAGRIILFDYSDDDPTNPTAFRRWEKDFMEHKRSGLFTHVGLAALDSYTTWLQAMQRAILKSNGRTFQAGGVGLSHKKGGDAPLADMRDYGVQLTIGAQYMGIFAGLPCDTLVTAHAKEYFDEDTEKTSFVPMLSGQQAAAIPLLFSEVWVIDKVRVKDPQEPGKIKLQHVIRTTPSGKWDIARSRINGQSERLADIEPADIKAILKKVGREFEDLPYKK